MHVVKHVCCNLDQLFPPKTHIPYISTHDPRLDLYRIGVTGDFEGSTSVYAGAAAC